MNYKAIIKKQSTIIVIAVICLTLVTIGASYALFFQVETNTNNQVVTAGTLDVSYGSGSSSLTATELIPMSDSDALVSSTLTGTIYIENKGTLPANFEVKIGNDTESFNSRTDKTDTDELLSHDYLRVAVYLNGDLIIEPTTLSSLNKANDDENMYSLFKEYLDITGTGNNTATIVLKVWIDINAPESIIGDYVYLKMDVTSEVDETIADGGEYFLKNKIIAAYGGEESITTLSSSSFANVTVDGESGLYKMIDDTGISYYFRGDVEDNYVKFGKWSETDTSDNAGKDMYWRIVRINGNGTIRMIYDGTEAVANGTSHTATIGQTAYNTAADNAKYVGYTYEGEDGNQVDSTIKGVLEKWYVDNLETNYGPYIADSIFCNDRTSGTIADGYTYFGAYDRLELNKNPKLTCSQKEDKYTMNSEYGNGYLTNSVGLITADEIAVAGGVVYTSNKTFYLANSSNWYWTLTPYDSVGYVLSFNDGTIYDYVNVSNTDGGARPVISIKANTIFSGSGKIDDPYVLAQ